MVDPMQRNRPGAAPAALTRRAAAIPSEIVDLDGTLAMESGSAPQRISVASIFRFRWTILCVFLSVAALAAPGVWYLYVPMYIATATVEVAPVIPRLVYQTEENGVIPLYQQYLSSQVNIVSSSTVLERVLDRAEVRKTKWYAGKSDTLWDWVLSARPPLERLIDELQVVTPRQTQLIIISMECAAPGEAKVIVDACVEEYLKFVRERFSEEDKRLLAALRMERDSLRAQIALTEKGVAQLRQQLGTGAPDELITQRRVRLDRLESELSNVALELSIVESQLQDRDAAPAAPGLSQVNFGDDAVWRDLNQAVRAAQQRLESGKTLYGEQHPMLQQMQQAVSEAQERLATRERQLASPEYVAALAGAQAGAAPLTGPAAALNPLVLRSRMKELSIRQKRLTEELDRERSDFSATFAMSESLSLQSEQLRQGRDKLDAVAHRLDVKETEAQVPASIRAISAATEPTVPVNQKRFYQLFIGAFVAAAGAGLGAGFLRARFNRSVLNTQDIATPARDAFLGRMIYRPELSYGELRDCAMTADSVRLIRTALLKRLEGRPGQVVQFTSAGPGAGKSTLTTLLARSLAQAGKRVLIVDGDVRRPSLDRLFNLPQGPGLMDVLMAPELDQKAVRRTDIPNLDIVTAGSEANRAQIELLANGMFTSLLKQWRCQYDIVLLDSAPLLAVADAAMIGQKVDGSVLVVREGHCRRADLAEAVSLLLSSGGSLVGTVFVGSLQRFGYGGYSYRYGYGYGYGARSGYALTTSRARGQ